MFVEGSEFWNWKEIKKKDSKEWLDEVSRISVVKQPWNPIRLLLTFLGWSMFVSGITSWPSSKSLARIAKYRTYHETPWPQWLRFAIPQHHSQVVTPGWESMVQFNEISTWYFSKGPPWTQMKIVKHSPHGTKLYQLLPSHDKNKSPGMQFKMLRVMSSNPLHNTRRSWRSVNEATSPSMGHSNIWNDVGVFLKVDSRLTTNDQLNTYFQMRDLWIYFLYILNVSKLFV